MGSGAGFGWGCIIGDSWMLEIWRETEKRGEMVIKGVSLFLKGKYLFISLTYTHYTIQKLYFFFQERKNLDELGCV